MSNIWVPTTLYTTQECKATDSSTLADDWTAAFFIKYVKYKPHHFVSQRSRLWHLSSRYGTDDCINLQSLGSISSKTYATVIRTDLVRSAIAWAQGNAKMESRGTVDWLPGFLIEWRIRYTQHNTSDYRILIRHETCSMPSDTRMMRISDYGPISQPLPFWWPSLCVHENRIFGNGLASFTPSRGLDVVNYGFLFLNFSIEASKWFNPRHDQLVQRWAIAKPLTTLVEDEQKIISAFGTPHIPRNITARFHRRAVLSDPNFRARGGTNAMGVPDRRRLSETVCTVLFPIWAIATAWPMSTFI